MKDSALLIALNATDHMEWGELQQKARTNLVFPNFHSRLLISCEQAQNLAAHLAKPLQQVQSKLDSAPSPTSKSDRR